MRTYYGAFPLGERVAAIVRARGWMSVSHIGTLELGIVRRHPHYWHAALGGTMWDHFCISKTSYHLDLGQAEQPWALVRIAIHIHTPQPTQLWPFHPSSFPITHFTIIQSHLFHNHSSRTITIIFTHQCLVVLLPFSYTTLQCLAFNGAFCRFTGSQSEAG